MDLQNKIKLIDTPIAEKIKKDNLPGLALAFTDQKDTLHVSTYGFSNLDTRTPVQPETMFEIGSIGKTFTALLMLQEVEAGRLDLDRPVSEYLPWWRVETDYEPITPHHLLSHTAGITGGSDLAPHGYYEVFALREQKTSVPAGKYFHYSNVGFKTLGYLLEAVCGQPYGEILQRGILDPLGMKATHSLITLETRRLMALGYRPFYDDRPPHCTYPLTPAEWHEYGGADGSVATTPGDLAIFLRMLLNRGAYPGGQIIQIDSFRLMSHGVGVIPEGGDYIFDGGCYGYGLMVKEVGGHTLVGHLGGTPGYHAVIVGDMDDGLGVTLQTNGFGDTPGIARFALETLRAVRQDQDPPGALTEVDHKCIEKPGEYAGVYSSKSRSFSVEAADHQIWLVTNEGDRIMLEGRGPDLFFVNHPDFSLYLLRFERNTSSGQIEGVCYGPEWFSHSRNQGSVEYPYPLDWEKFEGHYRSHNPWFSNFRVYIRKGNLWLGIPHGGEEQLFLVGSNSFRVGVDERSPERLTFDGFVDNRALRATLSGCDYYRTFTP